MPLNILHIASDEKFITQGLKVFDTAFPSQNELWVISNKPLRYVDSSLIDKLLSSKSFDTSLSFIDLNEYDYIVFHWLDMDKLKLIEAFPDYEEYIWLFFGGEVYSDYRLYPSRILSYPTLRLIGINPYIYSLKFLVKKGIRILINLNLISYSKRKLLRKISWFGMLGPEINILQNLKILSPKARQLSFCYYPIDYLFTSVPNPCIQSANKILIGNASSEDNNHMDILHLVKKLDIRNGIIIPLSYGDKTYASLIERECREGLKLNQIELLTEFMPIHLYHNKLAECEYIILNNWRQQGFGTILSSVYLGKKVFLNTKNTLLSFLQKLGVKIFDIKEIKNDKAFTPLSINDKKHNQSIISKNFNLDKISNDVRSQLTHANTSV